MSKLRLHFIMLCATSSFLITTAYADPFSFQSAPKQQQANNLPAAPMSPDDFEQKVQSLSQQASKEIVQETQKDLKQPTPNLPAASGPSLNTPSSTQKESAPAMPSMPAPVIEENTQTTTTTKAPAESAPPVVSAPPPAAAAPAAGSPAPAQSQVYTGFGGGSTNNTQPAAPSSQQQGGGWNIKY